jgi:hypothetical protein
LRKRAQAQPGLQIRLKLSVSSDDQPAGAFGLRDGSIAHPDLGHRPQIGDKKKIDIKTGIYRAKIHVGARLYAAQFYRLAQFLRPWTVRGRPGCGRAGLT